MKKILALSSRKAISSVLCPFDGIVRGLILNHRRASKDIKIGDVDLLGKREYCYTFSDRALAIGGAATDAILHWRIQGD